MIDSRTGPKACTISVPRRLVDALGGLSWHSSCPDACAVAALLALLVHRSSGQRRVGVRLGGDGSTHEHVFDFAEEVSIRGLLRQRSLEAGRDVDHRVSLRTPGAGEPGDGPVLLTIDGLDDLPLHGERDLASLLPLLEDALRQPDRAVGTWSRPGPGQPAPAAGSRRDRARSPDTTACQLFEDQVSRTPYSIAIVDGGRALSYAALNARADGLAATLQRLGVGPGALVGLHLKRSMEMLVALLGVLKAGAAYVPLDPAYPPARIRHMLEDSAAHLVLSERDLAGALPALQDRIILLDGGQPGPGEPRLTRDPARRADTRDLAYVIYTSGSTGKPKGVQIEHSALVSFLLAMVQRIGLYEGDAMIALTSLSFDIAAFELLGPLVVGGCVIMASHEQARDGTRLARLLRQSGATVVQATPSTWNMLLAAAPELPAITALCGGEAMQPSLARRLVGSVRKLWNVYGPTETTIWSTAAEIRPDDCDRPPVGTPLANTRTYVLDEDMVPVPAGQVGELFVGGTAVARGYLHHPRLTAERFVPDPFLGHGGRLFRTGDLARLRTDGVIELLGRRDHQVKIRGHRVELGEVETVLARAPSVAQVVVDVRESDDGFNRLEAFVVLTGPDVPGEELRAYLADRLPDYMIPTRIVRLAQLPRLPNGKVDRGALPREERIQARPSGAGHRQQSPVERWLTALWCEVLGVASVQAHDDFFSLGGDSLLAGTIMNRLERITGETVFVATLFHMPTLQAFCAYLETQYPQLVARLGDLPAAPDPAGGNEAPEDRRVDATMLRAFEGIVTGPQPAFRVEPRNRRVAFVLSAPRSGSTLLRVMLAGNPRLFSPPELELLGFDTMEERARAFTGANGYARDGLLRAIRELLSCDARTAERYVQERERGVSVAAFYRLLQGELGDRLLVDKTTTYAMDAAILRRAEQLFDEPLYVHLVRHPAAMILSYEEARLDQVFRHPHPFRRRELAELIWLASNQNVGALFATIPPHRRLQVRFEDLLAQPAAELARIAAFLGIPFVEAMLDPYADPRLRMVDGLHPESRMAGDFKFARFRRIEAEVADAWRGRFDLGSLSPLTEALAHSYGYLEEPEPGSARAYGVLQPR